MDCLDADMKILHLFEMLVSSSDEQRAYARSQLAAAGITFSGGLMYLMAFPLHSTDEAALSTRTQALHRILTDASKLLSAQFTVYLFLASGMELALLYQPGESVTPELIDANSVFLAHMSQYLIDKYRSLGLQILVSRETQEPDKLGFFSGALEQAASFSSFLTNPPEYAMVDFEAQNATCTIERLQTFRELVLRTSSLIRAGQLNPRRSAEEICALVLEHTALSPNTLHRHMDIFAFCFIERLIEDNIVDSAFLQDSDLFNALILGNNESNYKRNLERLLTLVAQRHDYISQAISSERMKKIKLYVEDNISNVNLSVSQVADYFSIHRGTLSEEFKKYFGCYLSAYIQQQRVAFAQQLLNLYPELSIQEVSVKAGYADVSTMYRAFKRCGLPTPSALKRAQQHGSEIPAAD